MYQVLLIEDNSADVLLVSRALSLFTTEFSGKSICTLGDALDYLAGNHVDVILLDLNLPDSEGSETFTRVYSKFPLTPIVVFSISDNDNLALELVKLGAQDYIAKKDLMNPTALVKTMKYAIERFSRFKAEAKIKKMKEEFDFQIENMIKLLGSTNDTTE